MKADDWAQTYPAIKFYHGPYFEHPWSKLADIFQFD